MCLIFGDLSPQALLFETFFSVKASGSTVQKWSNDNFYKDPLNAHMVIYVKAMLNHAMDLSFLRAVKRGNGI